MRLALILFVMMSFSCQAIKIINEIQDQDDHPFVDSTGQEISIKMSLTKVVSYHPETHEPLRFISEPIKETVKFGEVFEFNPSKYFPDHKREDEIFLVATFDSASTEMFLSKSVTIKIASLYEDDQVAICAAACLSHQGQFPESLQEFYKLVSYVVSCDEENDIGQDHELDSPSESDEDIE